ncbi:MAG TPA: membrane protein insertase YidC [Mycobacteriales bacterium]|jgi:YidC/Oxa1 family membrane protein insertase|nr:membrane protein insertase YidC [Mycobacteriales bacterium]
MSVIALLDPAVQVTNDLLLRVADLLPAVSGGAALAVAILVVTVLIRLLLLPLAVRGELATRARTALAPELAALRRRFAGDRQRLAQETLRLQREAGAGPLAGVGAALLQIPVLTTLYRAVATAHVAGSPNVLFGAAVLGAPLSGHWPGVLGAAGLLSPPATLFAALMTALTIVALWTGRQQVARLRAAGADAPLTGPTAERVAVLLPFTTVAFAVIAPVAVTIYLLSTTTWTLVERALLARFL